ncbi:MAG: thioredoxin domain-containing protein [Methanospirillum sp.]|uniref:thioredoxin family protein n=1 Tax=Methanospirillum sp. TaxID=45200 RepID=UPI0023749C86|nr:thioredoxin domain-containing protein [Methanospirillum sp.]MDD1728240.1 thioredoxin domain-containing protein [Methanospirillum sp.]
MGKPILIDFFAEWCGPCKRMGPIIDELKTMMGDSVEIKKLDVDQHMAEAQQYQVSVVPTIIIEKDGVLLQKYQGVTDAQTLASVLKPLVE